MAKSNTPSIWEIFHRRRIKDLARARREPAKMPVHLPLSGRTMAFDGMGKCVSGC
jgi:hypothetical protein